MTEKKLVQFLNDRGVKHRIERNFGYFYPYTGRHSRILISTTHHQSLLFSPFSWVQVFGASAIVGFFSGHLFEIPTDHLIEFIGALLSKEAVIDFRKPSFPKGVVNRYRLRDLWDYCSKYHLRFFCEHNQGYEIEMKSRWRLGKTTIADFLRFCKRHKLRVNVLPNKILVAEFTSASLILRFPRQMKLYQCHPVEFRQTDDAMIAFDEPPIRTFLASVNRKFGLDCIDLSSAG